MAPDRRSASRKGGRCGSPDRRSGGLPGTFVAILAPERFSTGFSGTHSETCCGICLRFVAHSFSRPLRGTRPDSSQFEARRCRPLPHSCPLQQKLLRFVNTCPAALPSPDPPARRRPSTGPTAARHDPHTEFRPPFGTDTFLRRLPTAGPPHALPPPVWPRAPTARSGNMVQRPFFTASRLCWATATSIPEATPEALAATRPQDVQR